MHHNRLEGHRAKHSTLGSPHGAAYTMSCSIDRRWPRRLTREQFASIILTLDDGPFVRSRTTDKNNSNVGFLIPDLHTGCDNAPAHPNQQLCLPASGQQRDLPLSFDVQDTNVAAEFPLCNARPLPIRFLRLKIDWCPIDPNQLAALASMLACSSVRVSN